MVETASTDLLFDVDRFGYFELDADLLEGFQARPVPWGFGALSRVTYQRTYSRDGERWWQTCRRVVEGMFTILRIHCRKHGLPWDNAQARHQARTAYERLWAFKWTPPGRGLWIMGTPFLYSRGGAALNNCGFVSTKDIARDFTSPFDWMFRMSMLGVGVGFDTRGRGAVTLQAPARGEGTHVIGDNREGWAEALRRLLGAYVGEGALPSSWDYSAIRPRGTPLKGFGGVASGPEPLRAMIETLEGLYDAAIGQKIDARLIVDTMNIIGCCVVAGGIRRSAQIAFGDPRDEQFLDLKLDREKVAQYRWASNNSIIAEEGMDYGAVARRTAVNGEPGYFWLSNARKFGRMIDGPDGADEGAEGSNPCVEQTLWDRELCCLVETFPAQHDGVEDYRKTLEVAYLYAKTVTLVPTEDALTNAVMQRNRRIGCSMTGIVQAINRFGYRRFVRWCDESYACVQDLDRRYSRWLRVPRSIKTTSIKPSGTVSLLGGATPGVHWEHAPYYIRRIRVSDNHPLLEACREAGYHTEPDHYAANTSVVSFPVHIPHLERGKSEVPVREKVDLAARMQHVWSDNQVSCTADFDPERETDELPRILAAYEDRLKAIVFLPVRGHGYEQAPYEQIMKEQYDQIVRRLKPIRGALPHEHELESRSCDGGVCSIEC